MDNKKYTIIYAFIVCLTAYIFGPLFATVIKTTDDIKFINYMASNFAGLFCSAMIVLHVAMGINYIKPYIQRCLRQTLQDIPAIRQGIVNEDLEIGDSNDAREQEETLPTVENNGNIEPATFTERTIVCVLSVQLISCILFGPIAASLIDADNLNNYELLIAGNVAGNIFVLIFFLVCLLVSAILFAFAWFIKLIATEILYPAYLAAFEYVVTHSTYLRRAVINYQIRT